MMLTARHVAARIAEHIAVLAVAVALWFGSLMLNAFLRIRLDAPILPTELVLFLLAFAMTVRVRNPSLALVVAAAWVGFGVYSFVINVHSLYDDHLSDRIARYSLAWSIETALVVLIGAAAGMIWLRRTSNPRPPQSLDQPAG